MLWTSSSRVASLDGICQRDRIPRSGRHQPPASGHHNVEHLLRFEESINGRIYQIEVSAVQPDRWRAYVVTLAGGPTAMMPFYGSTPDEAAALLVGWLTRAHHVASKPV